MQCRTLPETHRHSQAGMPRGSIDDSTVQSTCVLVWFHGTTSVVEEGKGERTTTWYTLTTVQQHVLVLIRTTSKHEQNQNIPYTTYYTLVLVRTSTGRTAASNETKSASQQAAVLLCVIVVVVIIQAYYDSFVCTSMPACMGSSGWWFHFNLTLFAAHQGTIPWSSGWLEDGCESNTRTSG